MTELKVVKVPKLVRDNMPEIWAKYQDKVKFRRITEDSEMLKALLAKLVEEAQEVQEDPCPEEIADLLEVLDAILDKLFLSKEEVVEARLKKHLDRGGFQRGIYLEKFEWGPLRKAKK